MSECAAPAYDALTIMAEAFTKAGGTNPEAVKMALYNTDHKGGAAYNETKFDSNGDLVGAEYSIGQIKNGKIIETKP